MERRVRFAGLLTEDEIETLVKMEDIMVRKGWVGIVINYCMDGDFEVAICDIAENYGEDKEATLPDATALAMENIIYQEAEKH